MRPEPVLLRRVRVERVVQTRETPLRRAVRRRAGFSRRRLRQPRQRDERHLPARREGSPRNSARRGEQSNESTRRRFRNPVWNPALLRDRAREHGRRRGPVPGRRVAPVRDGAQRGLVGDGGETSRRRGGKRRGRVSRLDARHRRRVPRVVKSHRGALRRELDRPVPRPVHRGGVRQGHRHVRAQQPRDRRRVTRGGLLPHRG
mmetsp:Transcript_8512/g.34830  ORF Transcript_8512/g.34830 Transcript_8512/m.34830 type:complete len:203 (-) Transcript_8512:421-1029(-)